MAMLDCVRILFYAFTVIFLGMGIGSLLMGIVIRLNGNVIGIVTDDSWFSAAYIMIAVGVFIILIAFVGCCGARKSSKCMLGFYLAVVCIIFIMEVAGAIYATVNRKNILLGIQIRMINVLQTRYGANGNNLITKGFDKIQTTLHCCGVNGPIDWRNSSWGMRHSSLSFPQGYPTPDSCCKVPTANCGVSPVGHANFTMYNATYNYMGCYAAIVNSIRVNFGVAVGVLGGFAGIQVLGIFFASYLMINMEDEKYTKA